MRTGTVLLALGILSSVYLLAGSELTPAGTSQPSAAEAGRGVVAPSALRDSRIPPALQGAATLRSAHAAPEFGQTETATGTSMTDLRMQVLTDRDPAQRLAALAVLANFRSPEVTAVLAEAAYDREPEIRYHACYALRLLIVDGLDQDGRARQALSQATLDHDPDVGRLAGELWGTLNNAGSKP